VKEIREMADYKFIVNLLANASKLVDGENEGPQFDDWKRSVTSILAVAPEFKTYLDKGSVLVKPLRPRTKQQRVALFKKHAHDPHKLHRIKQKNKMRSACWKLYEKKVRERSMLIVLLSGTIAHNSIAMPIVREELEKGDQGCPKRMMDKLREKFEAPTMTNRIRLKLELCSIAFSSDNEKIATLIARMTRLQMRIQAAEGVVTDEDMRVFFYGCLMKKPEHQQLVNQLLFNESTGKITFSMAAKFATDHENNTANLRARPRAVNAKDELFSTNTPAAEGNTPADETLTPTAKATSADSFDHFDHSADLALKASTFRNKNASHRNQGKRPRFESDDGGTSITCNRCGGLNHIAAECLTSSEKVRAYKNKTKSSSGDWNTGGQHTFKDRIY
jgi:hypothetical protein